MGAAGVCVYLCVLRLCMRVRMVLDTCMRMNGPWRGVSVCVCVDLCARAHVHGCEGGAGCLRAHRGMCLPACLCTRACVRMMPAACAFTLSEVVRLGFN